MSSHTPSNTSAQRELAERLKYLVISSSLLSTSLATHHSPRRSSGWRTPSLSLTSFAPMVLRHHSSEPRQWSPAQLAIAGVAPLVLMAGQFTLGFFLALLCATMHSISRAQDFAAHSAQRPSHLVQVRSAPCSRTTPSSRFIASDHSICRGAYCCRHLLGHRSDRGLQRSGQGRAQVRQ